MLADNKQIDIRTTMRNQNRSAALGITGEGGGRGASMSTLFRFNKIAAHDTIIFIYFFYFYLLKKIRLDISC